MKVNAGIHPTVEDGDLGDKSKAAHEFNTNPNIGDVKGNGDNVKATGRLSQAPQRVTMTTTRPFS